MLTAKLGPGRQILIYRGNVRGLRRLLAAMTRAGSLRAWMAAVAEN